MPVKPSTKIEEINDELSPLEYNDLVDILQYVQDQRMEKMNQRVYLQIERDFVENLFQNTNMEKERIEQQILIQENVLATNEENHQIEVKTYLQKLKQLDFENERNLTIIDQQAQADLDNEAEHHGTRLGELKHQKLSLKDQLVRNQVDGIKEIHKKEQKIKNVLETGKSTLAQDLKDYEERLEDNLDHLQKDLDLKIRVKLHEIEERKNFHINELIRNHEKAFEELKSFYSFITVENLNLIKNQKEELTNCKTRHESNQKKLVFLKEKNLALDVRLLESQGWSREGNELS